MAEQIIYTNSQGVSIELTNDAPFLLENVEGKGTIDADIQTQKAPFQDGVTYIDSLLNERSMELKVLILENNHDELLRKRQFISSVFNPKLGIGTLVYMNGKTQKKIKCVVYGTVKILTGQENKGLLHQRVIINLLCPEPFWEDISQSQYTMRDFTGSFTFPFNLPTNFAMRGDFCMIFNDGDVSMPIEVIFKGNALNPTLTNLTTGEFIKVNRLIPDGYKLILNTAFGNKKVEIESPEGTKENAFHYIDLDSTFFSLPVGETKIGFMADEGKPEVYVRYNKKYLTV